MLTFTLCLKILIVIIISIKHTTRYMLSTNNYNNIQIYRAPHMPSLRLQMC